jgi:hypothetical protein
MTAPKEAFYDEKISPLMTQIITLCKEAKINMLADFSLGYDEEIDETLFCTTAMPDLDKDDAKGVERMLRGYHALKPKSDFVAFTITSSKQ